MITEEVTQDATVETNPLKLGDYVVHIEDTKMQDVGIIAYCHSDHGYSALYSVRWLNDKHLSCRDTTQLRKLTPEEAVKAWCSECIAYH